jgi:acyl transferase domain-containing protein/phosphopantetheinyl transferase (holo-ACP synthase)
MTDIPPRSVAVIGMACIFPGAPDVHTYWTNICDGVDAITDVPPERWDEAYYDPTSNAPDRFYCKRGGFVDAYAEFDALKFGVMPVAAIGGEPDQMLALQVAAAAIDDAGYTPDQLPKEHTGVILGRGNYIGAGMTRLEQHVRTTQQLVTTLRDLLPDLDDETIQRVKGQFQAKLGSYGPDTAIGLVPNLTASRIANRLDFNGPAYTVDGACASSLIAIDHAVEALRAKRCDVVLAGGVHLSHDVAFWSVFCQLGALSRRQKIKPFDEAADGLVIGEGLGVVVLKRTEDAVRDGDRIYAVIRGVGVSSDGREASIMTPRVDGQVAALRRAWRDAGIDPKTIGLVEAHGTATPAGDNAELETLARFFGPADGPRAGLGSVKSMIGHTMPAAGIAGFIKAAMSVYNGRLPPSLHCDTPNRKLEDTRFRVLHAPEPWTTEVRRAAVNAFGFGGINAHVVMESYGPPEPLHTQPKLPLVGVWSGADGQDLIRALESDQRIDEGGQQRVVIHDPSPERLAKARALIAKGRRSTGRNGIWYEPVSLLDGHGKIAFLYPGVEAKFEPVVNDLLRETGQKRPFQTPPRDDLEAKGFAVIQLGRLLTEILQSQGIEPDVYGGHSIGEWNAMLAGGLIPPQAAEDFIKSLVPGSLKVPGVAFLAAGCGIDKAMEAMAGLPDIAISHDNCPHQVVLCGREASIAAAEAALSTQRVLCQILPFESGFHSPLFAPFLRPHRAHFETLPVATAHTPVWSATLATPFSENADDIRATAIEHLIAPIRFRELIENLYADGVRIFVQMGVGSLTGFVGDTLRGRTHLAVSALDDRRTGLDQQLRLRAALYVAGHDIDPTVPYNRHDDGPKPTTIKLSLGVPIVRLETSLEPLNSRVVSPGNEAITDPVIQAYQAMLQEIVDAGRAVVDAYKDKGTQSEERLETTRHLSVTECPFLLDHCFFRQPDGWPSIIDRFPVVPLTMLIELMVSAAQALVPDLKIVGLEHLRAYKWLVVEPATAVITQAKRLDKARIKVAIKGYTECILLVAKNYPTPPSPERWSASPQAQNAMSGDALYADRWMFHGPSYQGVRSIDDVNEKGIRGTLINRPAEGALLDNAGQLLGYWVMVNTETDRLAMPVLVERLDWYAPPVSIGAEVSCSVMIRRIGERQVRADMDLIYNGRVWCRIKGWTDQRFDTTARSWPIIRFPEKHLMSNILPAPLAVLIKPFKTNASQDYFHRRYLGTAERATYESLPKVSKGPWLSGRIAAKDAVRDWMWSEGAEPIFPVEVCITNGPEGAPHVQMLRGTTLHLSIAHTDDAACAIVDAAGPVGIDIEPLAVREPSFVQAAFSKTEQALLPTAQRDEWITRFWCAKEAVGKRNGDGLRGNPRRVPITQIEGTRILVDGLWVNTMLHGNYVIAWTRERDRAI